MMLLTGSASPSIHPTIYSDHCWFLEFISLLYSTVSTTKNLQNHSALQQEWQQVNAKKLPRKAKPYGFHKAGSTISTYPTHSNQFYPITVSTSPLLDETEKSHQIRIFEK